MKEVIKAKQAGLDDDIIENVLKQEQKRDGRIGGNSSDQLIDVASLQIRMDLIKHILKMTKREINLIMCLKHKLVIKKDMKLVKLLRHCMTEKKYIIINQS